MASEVVSAALILPIPECNSTTPVGSVCLDISSSSATMTTIMKLDLDAFLPSLADFPRPGVRFRDIGPLLADPAALAQAVDDMVAAVSDWPVQRVAGIETRGLI